MDAPVLGQGGGVLEEPVVLAGDVADQAAFDFAVGLALGAASLGRGGVAGSSRVRTTRCRARLGWRPPERLSRTGTVWPLAAGWVWPAQHGKAASVWQRPACDQAHRTVAATMDRPGSGEAGRAARRPPGR